VPSTLRVDGDVEIELQAVMLGVKSPEISPIRGRPAGNVPDGGSILMTSATRVQQGLRAVRPGQPPGRSDNADPGQGSHVQRLKNGHAGTVLLERGHTGMRSPR